MLSLLSPPPVDFSNGLSPSVPTGLAGLTLKRFLPLGFAVETPTPHPEKARRTDASDSAPLAVRACERDYSASQRPRALACSSAVNKQAPGAVHRASDRPKPAPLRRHETMISAPAPPALSRGSSVSTASPVYSVFSPRASASRMHPLLKRTPSSLSTSPPSPRKPPPKARRFAPLPSPLSPRESSPTPSTPATRAPAHPRSHYPVPSTPRPNYQRAALQRCMRASDSGRTILELGAHKGLMVCVARRARASSSGGSVAGEPLAVVNSPMSTLDPQRLEGDVEMADDCFPSGSSASALTPRSASLTSEDWEMGE